MNKKQTLLIASNNHNKIKELKHILKETDFKIVAPSDIGGIEEVEETGSTFEENAILKAIAIAEHNHTYVFSDDSGLEVEALNNRPGIYSARYAGIGATNEQRIEKLLKEMEGVNNRKARFVCVIAISNPEGKVMTFRGEIYGKIISEPKGKNGFGYDPVFQPDGYDKTFAELDSEIKNRISHRALAINKALAALKKMPLFELSIHNVTNI